jgi:hypothetical protein
VKDAGYIIDARVYYETIYGRPQSIESGKTLGTAQSQYGSIIPRTPRVPIRVPTWPPALYIHRMRFGRIGKSLSKSFFITSRLVKDYKEGRMGDLELSVGCD